MCEGASSDRWLFIPQQMRLVTCSFLANAPAAAPGARGGTRGSSSAPSSSCEMSKQAQTHQARTSHMHPHPATQRFGFPPVSALGEQRRLVRDVRHEPAGVPLLLQQPQELRHGDLVPLYAEPQAAVGPRARQLGRRRRRRRRAWRQGRLGGGALGALRGGGGCGGLERHRWDRPDDRGGAGEANAVVAAPDMGKCRVIL